jgi:ankyrin repeat protein
MRKYLFRISSFLLVALVFTAALASASEIHDACQVGDLEKVKQILTRDPEQLQAVTPEGKSPLHMATGWGRKEIVIFLLKQGANINAHNNQGGTPLHVAASRNHPECAAVLLDNGADIEALRVEGSVTPLAIAVFKNNLAAAEFFLSRGANLNARVMNGVTIRMVAERRSSPAMKKIIDQYNK